MKFIGTKVHAFLDFIMGALLITMPWVFGFEKGGAETWVPVILGAVMLVYSLFTDYGPGGVRRISMRTHLVLDMIGGALLAASPWIFGFAGYVWQPHLILGILEIGVALVTRTVPGTESSGHHHHRTAGAH